MISSPTYMWRAIFFILLLAPDATGFVILKHNKGLLKSVRHPASNVAIQRKDNKEIFPARSNVPMSASDDNNGGNAFLTAVSGAVVLGLFLGGSILPMVSDLGGGVAPLGNSVAFRDAEGQIQKQFEPNDKYRLSRAAIQEKLSSVPVFYVVGSDGEMETNIYMSYQDAKGRAGSKSVKATTLDQVEYPLILRRGRMRMAPPPLEITKAEESNKIFSLVPSKQAVSDAANQNIDLSTNDFPLFVADRLAFANPNGGLQVPLFLEKADCETSYQRLKGNNKNLAENPTLRVTTLNDEIYSMEKGTRPGMTQLVIYANADDVNKAVELVK